MLSPDGSGSSPNFPDAVADAQAHSGEAPAEIADDLTAVLAVAEKQVEEGPSELSDGGPPAGYLDALARLHQWAATCS